MKSFQGRVPLHYPLSMVRRGGNMVSREEGEEEEAERMRREAVWGAQHF